MGGRGKPVIKIPPTKFGLVLEVIGLGVLLLMWGFVTYYYPNLPARIPTHFGADGQPDGFGHKSILWQLAVGATVLYGFMIWASRYPHCGNYPVKVTEENAERLYRLCASLMREMGLVCNVVCAWIVIATCLVATNQMNGLGVWFLPYVLILMSVTTIYYMARMFMAR